MCETIVGAVIGVAGTLLGVGIFFMIEIWRSKKEKERVTLELKINTYADAIRYISLCSKIAMYESMSDHRRLTSKKNCWLKKAHYISVFIQSLRY